MVISTGYDLGVDIFDGVGSTVDGSPLDVVLDMYRADVKDELSKYGFLPHQELMNVHPP